MPDIRPATWIIIALLVLNAVGIGLILQELRAPEESTAATGVVGPTEENIPLSESQAKTEMAAEVPLQADTEIDPMVAGAAMPEQSPAEPNSSEIVIARVNGSDIGRALFISYLNRLASPEQLAQWNTLEDIPRNILMQSIDNAALDNLILQLAVQSKLDQNPAIQADIEQSKRNRLKTAFLDLLAPRLVNDQDIATQYATLSGSLQGKLEYRARHILLANEREAKIVDRALEVKEKTFDELAKLFSLDEATSLRGGDLGYVLVGQLNPEFETAIEPLAIGQISKPFKTELGWHIAIVDDRREAKAMTLEQATPVIRRKLEQQAIQRYLTELLDAADIEILVNLEQAE